MPYDDLLAAVLHSLERARALDGIDIVRDLYAIEAADASKGLWCLIQHTDHETGRIPIELMEEINARYEDAWLTATNHTPVVQR